MQQNSQTNSSTKFAENIQRRLSTYAAKVGDSLEEFPDTKFWRHVNDQLLRSATAPGAHYAEARSAQSRDDFVHKLALAAKELRESLHWLCIVESSEQIDANLYEVLEEGDELVAILFQSLQTARTDIEKDA